MTKSIVVWVSSSLLLFLMFAQEKQDISNERVSGKERASVRLSDFESPLLLSEMNAFGWGLLPSLNPFNGSSASIHSECVSLSIYSKPFFVA